MCVVVYNHCIQDFFKFLDPATGRGWCAPDSPSTMAFGGSVDLVRVARGLYLYLNLLGMPAFTAVSGYCSRGWARDVRRGDGAGVNRRFRGAVESLIVPWLIWQPFYVVYNYRTYPVQLWSPIGVTWYLTALFFWRVTLSALAQVNGDAILPALLVVGVGVGFTETPQTSNGLAFLDFQRAVAFLPVFYFGVTSVTPERLDALVKSKTARTIGWFGTVFAALAFAWMIRGASDDSSEEDDKNAFFNGASCFDEIQRYLWMTSGYDYGGSPDHPSAAPLAHAAAGNLVRFAADSATAPTPAPASAPPSIPMSTLTYSSALRISDATLGAATNSTVWSKTPSPRANGCLAALSVVASALVSVRKFPRRLATRTRTGGTAGAGDACSLAP